MNTSSKKWYQRIKLPRGVIIAICALPAVLTALFYVMRSLTSAMDWTALYVAAPVRGFFGMLSGLYPFSMMEILLTVAGIGLIYYIISSVATAMRRRGRWKILGIRLLPVAVAALYIWGVFCWLWNSGYHAPGFAERNGFSGGGVPLESLVEVTGIFAEKASELSVLVPRDDDGSYLGNRREMFAASLDVYQNISSEFPSLGGKLYRPKPMIYSWLMSRTGYTGMYFALTGEANINTRPPEALMPATVAHEHAHQLGVFAEDEANFVGILGCVTSGDVIFEYAGYLSGLSHLLSALGREDKEAYRSIMDNLSEEVLGDWRENSEFWQAQKRVETGIGFLDKLLTSVTVTVSDAVDTVYDGYLKSNNQELGIKSYGACVDLLVEYFAPQASSLQ